MSRGNFNFTATSRLHLAAKTSDVAASTVALNRIINLMKELYTVNTSCVHLDGPLSSWFEISSTVRQGCILALSLFLTAMDTLPEHTVYKGFLGASL